MKSLQTKTATLASLAVLMALTACGGGGSAPADASAAGNLSGSAPAAAPGVNPSPTQATSSAPSPSQGDGSAAPAPAPSSGDSQAPAPSPAAGPVQVTTTAASAIYTAQLASGAHIDVWAAGPSGQANVLAQVFDANGQKVGAPIVVFSGANASGWTLGSVAALSGSFVVTGSIASPQPRLYAQKISASGELLASGGASDPNVNGGLADMLLSDSTSNTQGYVGGPIFPNGDFYVVSVVQTAASGSKSRTNLSVDAAGKVTTRALLDSSVNSDYAGAPEIAQLGNANFLVAGKSTFMYAPIVVKIIDEIDKGADHIYKEENLGAAPGNSSSGAQVSALVNSNDGMLSFFSATSTGTSWKSFRISAFGDQLGVGPQLTNPTGHEHPKITGLANSGYVFTYYRGSQLIGQFYGASDQPVGNEFVIADNVVFDSAYSVLTTSDGFVAVYQVTTDSGPQVYEMRFTSPQ